MPGHHRLGRLLARGGMGAVYEAVHAPSGAPRAVKLLLGGADAEARERFRREAEVMATLDHPHVARVHTADLASDPPYLVQDLLPGGSLQDRLRQGPLSPAEVLALGEKVARAVAHAHARGVLHRDLKPANVLFDDRGEPRVTDFGLSRRAGQGSVALTATGQVLGTPAYMAPEQALGLREVDARSDVYGLGAVLYAALAGTSPSPARASPRCSSAWSRRSRRARRACDPTCRPPSKPSSCARWPRPRTSASPRPRPWPTPCSPRARARRPPAHPPPVGGADDASRP
ncbi:MAG: serine/threonine protein kinase [Planctomycetes bacterium]|nr:serine/threonine protein kinase [Planctomycetota bacterium]